MQLNVTWQVDRSQRGQSKAGYPIMIHVLVINEFAFKSKYEYIQHAD